MESGKGLDLYSGIPWSFLSITFHMTRIEKVLRSYFSRLFDVIFVFKANTMQCKEKTATTSRPGE